MKSTFRHRRDGRMFVAPQKFDLHESDACNSQRDGAMTSILNNASRRSPRIASNVVAVLTISGVIACSAENSVHFDLRGFQTKSAETEYATSFTREGTVVVTGDSRAAKDTYMVVFEVKHISGGDPDLLSNRPDPHYET